MDQIFIEWSGSSVDEFRDFCSIGYAKKVLNNESTLFDRFDSHLTPQYQKPHSHYITIDAMTSDECQNGGEKLEMNFSFSECQFGALITASTEKGICHLAFYDNRAEAISNLKSRFPNAKYKVETAQSHRNALLMFEKDISAVSNIKLHLKGTEFQLKVWESLLKIPKGKLATYGQMASDCGSPNAARAIGSAIGSNPIAFLIPCHRVVQTSGNLGGYMWGTVRKRAIIGWEAAKTKI